MCCIYFVTKGLEKHRQCTVRGGGPLVVHELVERTELSQPNVSNHLRCLLDCGLVASDRDGRFIRYRISSPRITALLNDVDALLELVAEGVEACGNYRE